MSHLENVTEAPKLHIGTPISFEYEYMIYLYNNFSKEDEEMKEDDEKEVLEILRRELGIQEDVPAMWWFDFYD